jgi:hypothetical protein
MPAAKSICGYRLERVSLIVSQYDAEAMEQEKDEISGELVLMTNHQAAKLTKQGYWFRRPLGPISPPKSRLAASTSVTEGIASDTP